MYRTSCFNYESFFSLGLYHLKSLIELFTYDATTEFHNSFPGRSLLLWHDWHKQTAVLEQTVPIIIECCYSAECLKTLQDILQTTKHTCNIHVVVPFVECIQSLKLLEYCFPLLTRWTVYTNCLAMDHQRMLLHTKVVHISDSQKGNIIAKLPPAQVILKVDNIKEFSSVQRISLSSDKKFKLGNEQIVSEDHTKKYASQQIVSPDDSKCNCSEQCIPDISEDVIKNHVSQQTESQDEDGLMNMSEDNIRNHVSQQTVSQDGLMNISEDNIKNHVSQQTVSKDGLKNMSEDNIRNHVSQQTVSQDDIKNMSEDNIKHHVSQQTASQDCLKNTSKDNIKNHVSQQTVSQDCLMNMSEDNIKHHVSQQTVSQDGLKNTSEDSIKNHVSQQTVSQDGLMNMSVDNIKNHVSQQTVSQDGLMNMSEDNIRNHVSQQTVYQDGLMNMSEDNIKNHVSQQTVSQDGLMNMSEDNIKNHVSQQTVSQDGQKNNCSEPDICNDDIKQHVSIQRILELHCMFIYLQPVIDTWLEKLLNFIKSSKDGNVNKKYVSFKYGLVVGSIYEAYTLFSVMKDHLKVEHIQINVITCLDDYVVQRNDIMTLLIIPKSLFPMVWLSKFNAVVLDIDFADYLEYISFKKKLENCEDVSLCCHTDIFNDKLKV